ncbi:MAG: adenylate/guanylate cyclase domain-containing protein [Acidimicrobiia bacterium]
MKRHVLIRRLVSVLLLTVVVTGIAWAGLSAEVLGGFQRRATDALFPGAPTDKRVVVVGIDRKAINFFDDPLPWPRGRMADLTDRLSQAGAAVIVFDLVFSQQSDNPAGDDAFAAAVKQAGNVVFGEGVTNAISGKNGRPPLALEGTNVYDKFAENAAGIGHVQVNQDPADGVVRSVSLVFDTKKGAFLPALALVAVMKLRGVTAPAIVRPGGVVAADRFIPTGSETSMVLNFSAKLSEPTSAISALDVLDGSLDASRVAGKIVFIGATDPLSGDVRLVPTNKSSRLPGVFLHANAANTMLTGTYLQTASDTTTLMWVALLTMLVGLLVLMLPLWLSPVVTLLLVFGCLVLVVARFDAGTINNIIYPLVAVALAFLGAVVLRYFGETRQRRRVTALFSQYVPETVAKRLVDEDRAETAAEGQRLDMTVLFCDLRGFTALSESLSPATVRVMLDHYYDRVTELVLAMRGTLMKYVGDEVFAVWGAPIPTSDHPAQALECAIAIQELTPQLNRELLERGAPEVSFGIGLNTGEAVAAHFGGRRRRQYDVVGDTVNIGARLCSTAGRGEIILSDQVLRRVPSPPPVEPVGPVELKGVSRELRLWRVVTSDSGNLAQSADTMAGHDADDVRDSASEGPGETTGETTGEPGGARVGAGEAGG